MLQIVLYVLLAARIVSSDLVFTPQDITVEINKNVDFEISSSDEGTNRVMFSYLQGNIATIINPEVDISKGEKKTVTVRGENPGHVIITGNYSGKPTNTEKAFVRITVGKSSTWVVLSDVVGWIYFAAWSISFYPQMYINWKRKSVVGLNFDFIALNFLGFFLYSLFNIGLYSFEIIKQSYHKKHPHSVNPVMINDIVFSVHAFVVVGATIIQCYMYERQNQKVSKFAKGLFGVYGIFLGISLVLACTDVIDPLDFLYYCSYVKLSITLIKYIPQAYMNYRRKSTVGWSIGNIFLDFTGGTLSMLQMIINSYNYNDWESIFGDPTKFGLGLFSVLFDIFFILQHYVFYRNREEV